MQYEKKIDDCIVALLNKVNSSMYYMEIYEKLCKSYREISIDAFNFHITKLREKDLLTRNDIGEKRGKKVYYSLTDKAKQQFRLKLLGSVSEGGITTIESESEEEKQEKLYLILFLFRRGYSYYLETEAEFQDFLLQVRLSEKDFRLVGEREQYRNGKHLYVKTFVSGRDKHNILLQIEEIPEKGQVNQVVSHRYKLVLPGFNATEISEGSSKQAFWHLNFTAAEVEQAIDIAFKEGLLKATFKFRDEWRFDISDQFLQWFLQDCWNLYYKVEDAMRYIWKYVRSSTEEERKWLEFIHGTKLAEEIRKETHQHRHSLNKEKQKEVLRNIKKLRQEINNDFRSIRESFLYRDTSKKYQFPIEKLLEVVWPKFLRDSTQ